LQAILSAVTIPAALAMGALGLAAFFSSLQAGQYEGLDGAAHRILIDDEG
jgi:cbb3-type cytochrome oxidase maturation protein